VKGGVEANVEPKARGAVLNEREGERHSTRLTSSCQATEPSLNS